MFNLASIPEYHLQLDFFLTEDAGCLNVETILEKLEYSCAVYKDKMFKNE